VYQSALQAASRRSTSPSPPASARAVPSSRTRLAQIRATWSLSGRSPQSEAIPLTNGPSGW